jgi:hypothetical protein
MTVVPVASLQEYFRDAVQTALDHQHLQVEDDTAHYVVSLLTSYARSEQLFDATPDGTRLKPLVVMLSEALEAADPAARQRGLQRLGDVSLFVAGFFADGFARKLIDIDYHIAMGGRAYAVLSETLSVGRRQTLGRVFAELAGKFQPLVDVLQEIQDGNRTRSDRDVLRLYEIWLKTGSQRARRLLGDMGVVPSDCNLNGLAH